LRFQHRKRIILLVLGIGFLILAGLITIFSLRKSPQPIEVQDLWDMRYDGLELEDRTVIIRGDSIFDPNSDFRFNAFYLVDSQTANEYRTPEYAFWFGIRIDGLTCRAKESKPDWICEPFDPRQATIFEFKGTVHLKQIGKRPIMWLSDVDFENSRQMINGTWQSIPLGETEVVAGKEE
jgi:hypothetical protein